MNRMLRSLLLTITAIFLAIGAFTGTQTAANSSTTITQAVASSSTGTSAAVLSCNARDNLSAIANDFISKCRKASIRQEFPSEFLPDTLGTIQKIKTARGKTAWKLLNDNRFKR
ncbi:hypothetical protein [Nonomuraea guangzhouensis]|uniref:Uncharacterized protein n=1 Tax=Nonomuraea guangzhouensis TaxID=1291555 RepID=A0ABW4G7C6_9ACTN|nr:hypothetical protein [Nonomuraea guangzhouensis]